MWEGWKIKEHCEKERKQETDLEKEGGKNKDGSNYERLIEPEKVKVGNS